MSALDARRRRPDEEALTHLHRMTDSLRRMVAASRVGSPEEEAHGSAHAAVSYTHLTLPTILLV